jgi:hypothetical protein
MIIRSRGIEMPGSKYEMRCADPAASRLQQENTAFRDSLYGPPVCAAEPPEAD